MNKITINLVCGCLWCDKGIPIKQAIKGKLLCSVKCLSQLKKAIEKEHGKGSCGYDITEVAK